MGSEMCIRNSLECGLVPLDIEGSFNRGDGRPPVGPDADTDSRYARELLDAREDVSDRLGIAS